MLELFYRELLRYFTRRTGDDQSGADVVQEAYLRVLALQHKGTAVREPRALLYQIGRNLLSNQALRRASEGRVLETLALVGADTAPSAEHEADARQQLGRLIALLESLPHKRRTAFILVRIHGMSYAEAAAYMEISELAVERHMTRALLDCAGYAAERAQR